MNPRPVPGTNKWELGFGSDGVERLLEIPGARANMETHKIQALPDAIAAACAITGYPPPPREASQGLVFPDMKMLSGLRNYQKEGVLFLHTNLKAYGGALLADEMGLGKTVQSLNTMRSLLKDGERVLVLCPASARETWRDELAKWGFASCAVLSPASTKAARAEWEKGKTAQWVVCSYDHRMVERAVELCFEDSYPTAMVFDEFHRLRGRESKRIEAVKDVVPMVKYKLGLTGTPLNNRTRDLWSQLHLLFEYKFGNRYDFDRRYCGGKVNEHGGWENRGNTNAEELRLRLSYYMLRREKKDVAQELPPLTRTVRWLDPTPEAKRAYQRFVMDGSGGALQDALAATLKGKADEAMTLAAEAKRFLLTTWMVADAEYMQRTLTTDYDTPCHLIHGGIPTERRQALIKDAEAKGWGIVATTDSVSEALNMQGVASIGICHAIDWVPLKMAQMEARIHRLNSKAPVQWVYLAMRDSADQLVVGTVVEKLEQWLTVVSRGQTGMRDSFGDHVNGAGAVEHEKAVLQALYDSMESE